MKKLTCIIAAVVLCHLAAAQTSPQALLEKCRDYCVCLDYSFTIKGELPVNGSGNVVIQGEAFRTSGNGLTVCCNGTTRWTVDENAKEVYIEKVAPGEKAGNIIRGYLKDIVNYSSGKDSLKGVVKRDGNTVEVSLHNIRISEPGDDMSRFTFDTGALDPAIWIVNDLR